MKILVISDTHGYTSNAEKLIQQNNFDYCIHLGDTADDCYNLENEFPMQKFIFVRGNNDYYLSDDSLFPYERVFTLENIKFFACHGHKYNVKLGTAYLKSKAAKVGADIALFGHTHSAMLDTADSVTLMNPGTFFTYGIIDISNSNVNCEIHDIYKEG